VKEDLVQQVELLSNKQMRMLELLDDLVGKCTDCDLYKGGRVKPYWTPMSLFLGLGEAPGKNEVEENEPFVGKAGKILGKAMAKQGFRKEEFSLINSVNCRPVSAGSNGKPTFKQVATCRKWVRKYIKVLNPAKIIAFGNYARGSVTGNFHGIVKYNGCVEVHYDDRYVTYSVHPAYCIYQQDNGMELLESSIRTFRDLRNR